MPTPKLTDEEALHAWQLYQELDNKTEVGRVLGISDVAAASRINKAKQRGLHLGAGVRQIANDMGVDITSVSGGWVKNKEGSFRFKNDMSVSQADTLTQIKDIFNGINAAEPIEAPDHLDEDLLTIYPIADLHLGMYASKKETGAEYNPDIAFERIRHGIGKCAAASPRSRTGVVIALGDLLHADDQNNQTPQSKHQLDVVGRHFENLGLAIKAMACAAETAALRHEKVIVVVQRGNHDMTAYMAVLFALAERYRDNPRITVQKVGEDFFVMQHGKCLIASHHGDKAKAERLVMGLADGWPKMWGATVHRYYFTGHMHHLKQQDIGGVQVEQLRALTARDAYAASHAYSGRSQVQAITLHKDEGEVRRVKVNF